MVVFGRNLTQVVVKWSLSSHFFGQLQSFGAFGPKISFYTTKVKTKQLGVLLVAIALITHVMHEDIFLSEIGQKKADKKRMPI
jgi:1,4-dihydroxy-2-naphthoate octaprenyltransferase